MSDTAKLIGRTVGLYPAEVARMLNQNGVTINADPSRPSDMVKSVIAGLGSSEKFKNDFIKFAEANKKVLSSEEFLNFDWGGTITGLTALGGQIYTGQQSGKLLEKEARIEREKAQAQLAIAQLNQQTVLAQLEAQKALALGGGKDNTVLYVGLGIGAVAILGTVIYLATKK